MGLGSLICDDSLTTIYVEEINKKEFLQDHQDHLRLINNEQLIY